MLKQEVEGPDYGVIPDADSKVVIGEHIICEKEESKVRELICEKVESKVSESYQPTI